MSRVEFFTLSAMHDGARPARDPVGALLMAAVSTPHERLLARIEREDPHRLLTAWKAVRAVVELHREASDVPLCVECWNGASEDYHAWPCQTIRSIAEALGVEVDGG